MPSMFSSSRRRGSSASRTRSMDQSTSTAATLAARSAAGGLYRPPSSASLSSAAAAAALRSATTTPEPVGSIQTKRMVRRGSQSSIGSGSIAGPVRGGLQRQNSSGSMTDRTFRSPSPGSTNGSSYANGATSPDPYAPPVPAIPKNIPSGHKRSSSMDAPQRVMSPNRAPRGRGVSADRASMASGSARKPPRLSDVAEELERSDSSRNMNFSRPRASQPSSPLGSPTADKKFTHSAGPWHPGPMTTTSGPSQTSATAMEQKIARIQAAAGQPARNSSVRASSQPANLTKANLDAVSAAADDYETVMVFDANSRTFVPQKRLKPKASEPPSPVIPEPAPLKPGQYDPSTRTIVPHPMPAAQPVRTQRQIPAALNTSIEPPPRNPARLSPATSPTSARHPLIKHPSVVHEQPDEDEGLSSPTDSGRIIQTTAGPAKAYTPVTITKPRSSSLDVPRGAMNGSVRGRNISASPSPQRARFSASPVVQATIHDPPARDISPAKSAMKHSPSPSVRAASPLAHFSNPKSPSSETSETPSLASHDGMGKKKKSVRVSFDEQPQVAGLASPTSPKALDDLDDDDDLMKPRPALPSFGSVRKNRANPEYAEKVTEMAPERTVSSDHAIGSILVNANESTKPETEPVAPVVTSKETAGDVSDSDYSVDEQGAPSAKSAAKVDNAGVISRDFASDGPAHSEPNANVPGINLLPPTPGVEQETWEGSAEGGDASPRARLSKEVVLPGGWNEAENEAEPESDADAADIQLNAASPPSLQAIDESDDDDDAAFSDAAEDLSDMEGGFASLDAIAVSPVVPTTKAATKPVSPESPSAQKIAKSIEKEDTGNAAPVGDWSQATAYWSTLSRQQREQIEREHFSSDDEARPAPAVKKTKKKTAPKQNAGLAPNTAAAAQKSVPAQPSAQPAKPAMKKSMRAQPEPDPVENQVHMRSSMRGQPDSAPVENQVQMRSSMRAGGGSGMASTMRDGSRPGSLQKKTMRPQSTSSQLSNSAAATAGATTLPRRDSQSSVMSQPKTQPRVSNQPTPAMSARLQKELRKADDSDSDSSFRKQRRSARTHAGFAMKSSMRGGPDPVEQRPVSPTPPRAKGRDSFSIRSLSPTGSLFGRKKMNRDPPARASSVEPSSTRTTLRGAQPQRSSLRAAAPAAAPAKSTTSRFKSRFADSDDEDDAPAPSRGGRFASRFADSDDEDDVFTPTQLAPVRGIPRRQGQNDGDSTDLSDEDEHPTSKREKFNAPMVPDPSDVDKAMEAARKKLGITDSPVQNGGKQGGALAQGSLRDSSQTKPASASTPADTVDTTPKKRGFMGSILRRNRASTASVPGYKPSGSVPSSPPTIPMPAALAAESDAGGVSTGSPTAGPKVIRRTSYQQAPRMRRGDSTYSNATAPPAVGESSVSDWPLPPVPQIPDGHGGVDRPNTSEGTGVRFAEGTEVYSARTGKKKKFSMLRKAFGLHD